MGKKATASITLTDLSDGELIGGFTLEQLLHKTSYYDKNDVDSILNYRIDWRKNDAMFLEIEPDANNEIEFMLPYNNIEYFMRIIWDDDNSFLLTSSEYEPEKFAKYVFTNNSIKTIALIGTVGIYVTKGYIKNITQFGTMTTVKSLGNVLSHLSNCGKSLNNISALDSFKSSSLEAIDGYAFLGMTNETLPSDIETWDVSNVHSMRNMLNGKSTWNKNLQNWTTTHLSNVEGLFANLTSIPFSINTWDFSNVMIGDSLFKDLNLSNVDVSLLRFTQLLTADSMYENTYNLSKFHLQPANNTASIVSANYMFKGSVLNNITINNDFDELVYADDMFMNATLNNCTIVLNVSKCISVKNMFKNAILNNTIITLNFDRIEDCQNMFDHATFDANSRLNINFGTTSKTICDYMFSNCVLNNNTLNNITNTSKILYASYMFYNTSFNIDLTKFDLSNCYYANSFIKNNTIFDGNVGALKFEKTMELDSAFEGCLAFTGKGLENWNCSNLKDIDNIFKGCTNLNNNSSSIVLCKSVETMNYAFYNCSMNSITTTIIDLPNVKYMDYAFYNCSKQNLNFENCLFNELISGVSAFEGCSILNSSFRSLVLSKVTSNGLNRFFANCSIFNNTLPQLILNNISSLDGFLLNCTKFNKPLNIEAKILSSASSFMDGCSEFNSAVKLTFPFCTNASSLFRNCLIFNQSINDVKIATDVGEATINLNSMFESCKMFNQPVYSLPTKNGTLLNKLFYYCEKLNQDLSSLQVTKVTEAYGLFFKCSAMSNENFAAVVNWNMSNCTIFDQLFYRCTNFNQPINNWNVTKANTISSMFLLCTNFNQNLNNWNVSQVFDFNNCFYGCSSLTDQVFSNWNVSLAIAVNKVSNMFVGVGSNNTLPDGII